MSRPLPGTQLISVLAPTVRRVIYKLSRSDWRGPLVSVVIPTFNRAHCIGRAIASVADQSYPSLEIIVVDDGSTDGTVDRIRSTDCPRPLKIIETPRNQGAAMARNLGIAAATGEFVAFLDSDDAWHRRKVERQVKLLQKRGPAFGACYTGIATYDERGRLQGVSRATQEGDVHRALLTHNLVGSTSCALVRRRLLLEVGGFTPELRSCQDWDLWIRLAERTRFACAPEFLTILHVEPLGRITSSGRGRLSGHLYMYRTHLEPSIKARVIDPGIFRTLLGDIFMQMGRPGYAARLFYLNWRDKRHSLKRLMFFVLARLRFGASSYFQVVELLARWERVLRPTPVRPPGDGIVFRENPYDESLDARRGPRSIAILLDGFPEISQTFINNQILSLLDLGIEVTILSFGRGAPSGSHASTARIAEQARVVYLGVPRRRSRRLLDLAMLAAHPRITVRLLRRMWVNGGIPRPYDLVKLVMAERGLAGRHRCFDFVFCHFGPNGEFGVRMRDAGVIKGGMVTFFHGYDFSLRSRVQGRGPYRRLFEQGEAFVANSNYTRGRIIELGCPAERTVTVPVGLFPDFFPFRERVPVPDRPVRFLTIGRLVEKKGHAVAIHAFRRVREAGVTAAYAIVGDGPMRQELEQLIASLDLGDVITLLGSRTQEDVRRLAENSDIFVLASTSSTDGDAEGQGLVLQEAQATGLPVIATKHNGFPEGLLDGVSGVLVPERDSAGLAGAMIDLARTPERWGQMGRAGAAFVRDRFDQPRLTENLLTLLIPYECRGGRQLRVVRPEPRRLVLGRRQVC